MDGVSIDTTESSIASDDGVGAGAAITAEAGFSLDVKDGSHTPRQLFSLHDLSKAPAL